MRRVVLYYYPPAASTLIGRPRLHLSAGRVYTYRPDGNSTLIGRTVILFSAIAAAVSPCPLLLCRSCVRFIASFSLPPWTIVVSSGRARRGRKNQFEKIREFVWTNARYPRRSRKKKKNVFLRLRFQHSVRACIALSNDADLKNSRVTVLLGLTPVTFSVMV